MIVSYTRTRLLMYSLSLFLSAFQMLLTNGSLAHKLVHGSGSGGGEGGKVESPTVVYPAGKYCVDDMVVLHNATGSAAGGGGNEEDNLEFAYICVSNRVSTLGIVHKGHSGNFNVAALCRHTTMPQNFDIVILSLSSCDVHSVQGKWSYLERSPRLMGRSCSYLVPNQLGGTTRI